MQNKDRIDTEQLIRNCRQGYDATILQQKIKQLQLTLALRNKQLQYMTCQLASNKQEHTIKINNLDSQLTQLKKQSAELRYSAVKNKRMENQKCQKIIETIRKDHQQVLAQKVQQYQLIIQQLKKFNQFELKRAEEKYEKILKMQKKENKTYKHICNQKSTAQDSIISRLESEKQQLIMIKRDNQQKIANYKDGIQKIKTQTKKSIQVKEEQLILKNGQIQGLKLQQKFLREKLQEIHKNSQERQKRYQKNIEQLVQINNSLTDQNKQFKLLLIMKDEEILQNFHSSQQHIQSRQTQFVNVHECNHLTLIKQLQRNLELKDRQLQNIKGVMAQWNQSIGFDKPVSQRLQDISMKYSNVEGLNNSFIKALKNRIKNKSNTPVIR